MGVLDDLRGFLARDEQSHDEARTLAQLIFQEGFRATPAAKTEYVAAIEVLGHAQPDAVAESRLVTEIYAKTSHVVGEEGHKIPVSLQRILKHTYYKLVSRHVLFLFLFLFLGIVHFIVKGILITQSAELVVFSWPRLNSTTYANTPVFLFSYYSEMWVLIAYVLFAMLYISSMLYAAHATWRRIYIWAFVLSIAVLLVKRITFVVFDGILIHHCNTSPGAKDFCDPGTIIALALSIAAAVIFTIMQFGVWAALRYITWNSFAILFCWRNVGVSGSMARLVMTHPFDAGFRGLVRSNLSHIHRIADLQNKKEDEGAGIQGQQQDSGRAGLLQHQSDDDTFELYEMDRHIIT